MIETTDEHLKTMAIENEQLQEAHARANREAILEHARMGRSVCFGGPDGQVVWVSPTEIFARYGLDEFGRPKPT